MKAAWLTIICLLAFCAPPSGGADRTLPFTAASLQKIEQAHSGRPFLLVLWATDCAPCRGEFRTLRKFLDAHPDVPAVLIATDGPAQAGSLPAVLHEFGLDDVESWCFADTNTDRLRYSVDTGWYGEIPRSYLYDARGQRRAVSGILTLAVLQEWLAATRGT